MGETGSSTLKLVRRYFWKPPRAHGEVIEDRSVSFLELFYDLVYVVVIARAAHTLAASIAACHHSLRSAPPTDN